MTARLFVIEGTAASGKSATAKFVADCLRLKGRRVVCIDEGSNANPADYEAHAFLNDAALTHFTDFEKQQIFAVGYRESGGIAAPLTEFSGDLLKKLMHFKIYDFLPWETEKPVMLDKWRKFAATAKKDAAYVLNAVLLQNPFCETMMRFGFPLETTREYVREICVAAAPLSPAVIYLHNANIGQSVKNVVRERGKKWLNAVVSYHENGAFGKSVGAKGFDGYITCLTERQKRELEILPTLPVASTVIENANADWQTALHSAGCQCADARETTPSPAKQSPRACGVSLLARPERRRAQKTTGAVRSHCLTKRFHAFFKYFFRYRPV